MRLVPKGAREVKPYPAYRPSGVEWVDEIPAHWEVKRLRTFANVQLSNVDKKSVEGQTAVLLCNYVDVYYNERICPGMDFMSATASEDQIRRFSLRKGDVLITKDSETWNDIVVPAVVAQDLPGVLCGYHLAHIRPDTNCDGAFLSRAFAAMGPRDQFHVSANGITRFGLTGDAIRSGEFPFPPLPEQQAIADFLDRETARIDALVAKKERLIELLQEKRTALISQAVTKGLDRNAPTKDSGVEWLGEIPAHWEVSAIKNQFSIQLGKMLQGSASSSDDLEVPYLKAVSVQWFQVQTSDPSTMWASPREVEMFGIKRGDLLVCEGGEGGRCGILEADVKGYIIQNALHRVRPFKNSTNDFLKYILRTVSTTGWFEALNERATIAHFTGEKFSALRMPIPPLLEQQRITSIPRPGNDKTGRPGCQDSETPSTG